MNQVKHFREIAELSQKSLADACDCSQPTIAAIEAGGTTNVHLAQRIAAALNRSLEETFPVDLRPSEEQKPDTAAA